MRVLKSDRTTMVTVTVWWIFNLVFAIQLKFSFTSCLLNESTVIPHDYCKFTPPRNNDKPIYVYISCQILDIDNIDEDDMEYRLVMYLVRIWRDSRLILKNIVSSSPVVFPGKWKENIWVPKLVYDNTKNLEMIGLTGPHATLKVLPDEALYYEVRSNFRVACPMQLENYPLDVQSCSFQISLLHNDNKQAVLRWIEHDKSPYRNMGISVRIRKLNLLKYEMADIITSDSTKYWLSSNFSVLVAKFIFIRRLTGSIMSVYIPSTMVVTLSWVSFWIDVDAAPARITLGVTSVLTIVTQIIESRNASPPVDYLKAIDLWLLVCAIFVFSSLVEYAASYQYVIRKLTPLKVTDVTQAWTNLEGEKNILNGMVRLSSDDSKQKKELASSVKSNPYDKFSRYLFPLVFLIFGISYWTYYMRKRVT